MPLSCPDSLDHTVYLNIDGDPVSFRSTEAVCRGPIDIETRSQSIRNGTIQIIVARVPTIDYNSTPSCPTLNRNQEVRIDDQVINLSEDGLLRLLRPYDISVFTGEVQNRPGNALSDVVTDQSRQCRNYGLQRWRRRHSGRLRRGLAAAC